MSRATLTITLAVFIFAAVGASSAAQAAENIVGTVMRVSDGDTIWVTDAAHLRHKVRLQDIDAPESSQPFGSESTARMKELVYGKMVRITSDGHDMYGRVLGVVWLNGEDINLKMVREGMAWVYQYSTNACYIDAQSVARTERCGLWGTKAPMNPFEWRKRRKRAGKARPLPASDISAASAPGCRGFFCGKLTVP